MLEYQIVLALIIVAGSLHRRSQAVDVEQVEATKAERRNTRVSRERRTEAAPSARRASQ